MCASCCLFIPHETLVMSADDGLLEIFINLMYIIGIHKSYSLCVYEELVSLKKSWLVFQFALVTGFP